MGMRDKAVREYGELCRISAKRDDPEAELGLSEFQRGVLWGARQAMGWLVLGHVEPMRAILRNRQLEKCGCRRGAVEGRRARVLREGSS